MRSAAVTAGFLILTICISIFLTLEAGEDGGSRDASISNAGDELEEIGEGIRLGMDKEEVIQLWGDQPTNFDGVMDGDAFTAFQFRTGQWDITGPKEIALIGREAHQFGKTGKIIFVFWNEENKARDVAICYRTEGSEEFRSFYTGSAGKDKACGTDGYVIVMDSELLFVNEEAVPLLKNEIDAEFYFQKQEQGEVGAAIPIKFEKSWNPQSFLKTGDKVKMWFDSDNDPTAKTIVTVKQLFIMDSSLEKKD
ncbi:hypothetical protein [Bacillus sp. FJAT-27445]|uniref:hypothetical protein n=1 Tax=Bacillus sp. FJAT-27445 TaxID=1679166 RepID=UPI000743514B|nr:hypothetical protein [Bacillus sp. FJAT-27445]